MNADVASGDVHVHQRHKGIYTFEKPQSSQVNSGRFTGTNSSSGNEVDFARCYVDKCEIGVKRYRRRVALKHTNGLIPFPLAS